MAGLLDSLFPSDTGGGIGGLLSYLQDPRFQQIPKDSSNKAITDALTANPYEGGLPQIGPQPSIWDQPGLTYKPFVAQAPSPFDNAPKTFGGFAPQAAFGGFPSTPQSAPIVQPQTAPAPLLPPAQNVASPQQPPVNTINVGGYQMPQIGNLADFTPKPQAIPPQVANANAQVAPDEQQLPPAFGGDYLSRVKAGGGLIRSLFGATPSQQNLKAQYDAFRTSLIANGDDPQTASSKAMVAALNPEAAKTILPELFTNKEKYQVISEDPLEGKKYGFVNERNQTINGKPLQAGQTASVDTGGLKQTIANLDNMPSGATQAERLAQVPEAYRGYVKSLLAGQALPSNIGRSQLRGPIMTLAHAVDPTFDETNIPLRFKTAADYAPNGQSGRSIVALNTVQHHIGKLSDDLENLGDTGWTLGNSVWNAVARNTPLSQTQGKAAQAVQDDIKAVTDEMSAAYKAGRVSDHEIEAWSKLANSNLPLRQLKQGIYDFVGLLNGKRDQLNETHQSILGRDAPGINRDLNEAITKKVTERNGERSASSGAPQVGTVQQGYRFKGGNPADRNSWEKVR